jgi:hypothetical protein
MFHRPSLSNLYLSSLGTIFSIAFISYYIQYPALSSSSGIEPCEKVFRRAFPSLWEMIAKGYFDVDSFVELVNLLGLVISVVIARWVINAILLDFV